MKYDFEQVYNTYYPKMLRRAMSILRNEQDAQDAVQDALLRIWKTLPRLKEGNTLSSWIYRVVTNTSLDIYRKNARYPHENIEDHASTLIEEESELSPEEKIDLSVAMKLLTPKQRTAFTLIHEQGYRQVEATKLAGVTLRAFRVRLRNAEETIKEAIA